MSDLLQYIYDRRDLGFNVSNTDMDLRDLVRDHVIDFDVYLSSRGVNLQRDFVWDLSQRQSLIESILMGRSIPPLCLIIHDSTRIKVIDGKQRLKAHMDFVGNSYPVVLDGASYLYQDLPDDVRSIISRHIWKVSLAYSYSDDSTISDDSIIKWFHAINYAGTPMDREHLEKLL